MKKSKGSSRVFTVQLKNDDWVQTLAEGQKEIEECWELQQVYFIHWVKANVLAGEFNDTIRSLVRVNGAKGHILIPVPCDTIHDVVFALAAAWKPGRSPSKREVPENCIEVIFRFDPPDKRFQMHTCVDFEA